MFGAFVLAHEGTQSLRSIGPLLLLLLFAVFVESRPLHGNRLVFDFVNLALEVLPALVELAGFVIPSRNIEFNAIPFVHDDSR